MWFGNESTAPISYGRQIMPRWLTVQQIKHATLIDRTAKKLHRIVTELALGYSFYRITLLKSAEKVKRVNLLLLY